MARKVFKLREESSNPGEQRIFSLWIYMIPRSRVPARTRSSATPFSRPGEHPFAKCLWEESRSSAKVAILFRAKSCAGSTPYRRVCGAPANENREGNTDGPGGNSICLVHEQRPRH